MVSKKTKILQERIKKINIIAKHKMHNYEGELTTKEKIEYLEQQIKLCEYDLVNACKGNVAVENKIHVLKQQVEELNKLGSDENGNNNK